MGLAGSLTGQQRAWARRDFSIRGVHGVAVVQLIALVAQNLCRCCCVRYDGDRFVSDVFLAVDEWGR